MPDTNVTTVVNVLQRGLARDPRGSGRTRPPIAWASTRGRVREDNQDRILIAQAGTDLTLAILADGMGGMQEGARAAVLATSAAAAHCLTFPTAPLPQLLGDALSFANDEVFRAFRGEGGAVAVIAAWSPPVGWYVAHAGDARAYQVDDEGYLQQLTTDDTVDAQLRRLGRPSTDGSRMHSQLLQYIGVGQDFEPHVSPVREMGRGLVLTSDGVHDLPLHIMEWIVRSAGHLHVVAERLVTASEWEGGRDNGTVIAISFQKGHGEPRAGVMECWLPGEHIILLAPTQKLVDVERSGGAQPERRKLRNKKGRGRKNLKEGSPSGHDPSSGRQLPIIDFGDATPSAADATPLATPEQSSAFAPLTRDKKP